MSLIQVKFDPDLIHLGDDRKCSGGFPDVKGGEEVLEIGAGSGYAAAVLSEIAADVYTVERLGQLAEQAAARLADLGYDNVHVLHGDGTQRLAANMRHMMQSSSRPAARRFRNRSRSS